MQQVNLFQPAFTTQISLGPDLMLRAVIALTGALAIAGAWAAGTAWWAKYSVADLQDQVSAEITSVAVLSQQLEKHLDTSAFDQRAAGLDKERLAKLQLLQRLRDSQISNLRGFSPQILALSRQHVEGTWPTGFNIEDGGQVLSVRGNTLDPSLVPRFIERLGEAEAYEGVQFRSFELRRPDEERAPLEFMISNRSNDPVEVEP